MDEDMQHIFDLLISEDIPEENFLPGSLYPVHCWDPDYYLSKFFGASLIEGNREVVSI
jgi:hypothetical protein